MNVMTIITVPVSHTSDGQDNTGKFKLVDSDGVIMRRWPAQVTDPVMYTSRSLALDAGEVLFAVGENFMGQNVLTCTRVGDERLDITLGE
jgi:hypothetical protein